MTERKLKQEMIKLLSRYYTDNKTLKSLTLREIASIMNDERFESLVGKLRHNFLSHCHGKNGNLKAGKNMSQKMLTEPKKPLLLAKKQESSFDDMLSKRWRMKTLLFEAELANLANMVTNTEELLRAAQSFNQIP